MEHEHERAPNPLGDAIYRAAEALMEISQEVLLEDVPSFLMGALTIYVGSLPPLEWERVVSVEFSPSREAAISGGLERKEKFLEQLKELRAWADKEDREMN